MAKLINIIFALTMWLSGSAVNAKTIPSIEGPKTWKAVFLTGDDSIPAFDNARVAVAEKWKFDGIQGIKQLSMDPQNVSKSVSASSAYGLDQALKNLLIKADEGCLIWMTSHGNEDGLYMRDQPVLSPERLGEILNKRCATNPTVIIVSACHSGTFLSIKAPNRAILTAARKDRKSFGCSIKYQYTFFDECMLKYYGKSRTFEGLFIRAKICITKKEAEEEATPPSMPQISVGKQMKNLVIPRKEKPGSTKLQSKIKKKT
jgi:hypothetical protein